MERFWIAFLWNGASLRAPFHFLIIYYVFSLPNLPANIIIPRQNLSHPVNAVSDGSPSRMRRVRRISLGMTTLPRSSILLTIPVAFILKSSCLYLYRQELLSAGIATICRWTDLEIRRGAAEAWTWKRRGRQRAHAFLTFFGDGILLSALSYHWKDINRYSRLRERQQP